jgi:membrane-associated PAP2 superfamily phosphatase
VARNWLIVLLVLAVATGAVFALVPEIDLAVAGWFHALEARADFAAAWAVLAFIRDIGPYVIGAAVAPAIITAVMKVIWPRRPSPMTSRAALFLISTLLLGPGLLVNGALKEGWSRARPGMVTQFGGDYAFTAWWDPRGTCDSNCSFVSGETSASVWLAAPAMLTPPAWRVAAYGGVAVFALLISFVRMLVGGHFLSDILFAAIFTGLVIWGVYGVVFRWLPHFTDAVLDRFLERLGGALTRPFAFFGAGRDARPDKPA